MGIVEFTLQKRKTPALQDAYISKLKIAMFIKSTVRFTVFKLITKCVFVFAHC